MIKAFGSLAIQIVPNSAKMTRKKNGLMEGECSFSMAGDPVSAGMALDAYLQYGSAHPYNNYLWLEVAQINFTATGAMAVASYAGASYEALEEPVYSLMKGSEEVPIEVHPDFSTIAGTPSSPQNGAVFLDPSTGLVTTNNAKGVFDRFATYLSGGAKNDKAGIEAYLDAVVVYRESYVTQRLPQGSRFNKIWSSVPGPGLPGDLGGRNWLYTGFNYTQRGNPTDQNPSQRVFEITNEWKLSGINGWDAQVYS